MRSQDNIIDEDDFFKDSRMSFGDHLEVLRSHLWRAIYGLMFCMVIGFVLDGIGAALGNRSIGIGRPLMDAIQAPVRQALVEFYDKRRKRLIEEAKTPNTVAAAAVQFHEVPTRMNRDDWSRMLRVPAEQLPEEGIEIKLLMSPLEIDSAAQKIEHIVRPRELTALSAQESFVIYFKVSMIAGLVIASPWVFWQIWSFIAAGLYPSEKKYVHSYLPFSVGLFIAGVVLCQIFVMPKTVAALLWFNDFLGVTPDLRLSEWLSLAIMLPLVFGCSFQTPLVMLFLQRLGIMTPESFKKRRKAVIFGLAVFAAIITPTPDAVTMCYLWLPMVALYELGIWLSVFLPGAHNELEDLDVPSSEELMEV